MDYFDHVERDLRLALRHGAHLPWRVRAVAGARRTLGNTPRRGRPLALVLLATLTAGSALAATGVIPLGSPVEVGPRDPHVGTGVPTQGGARLLPIRYADPEGGPPWGMRIVRTTRGLLCMQLGRIEDGRLGRLGIDGAFHEDGRFHPLPAAALPEASHLAGLGSSIGAFSETTYCALPGHTFAYYMHGVDRRGGAPHATPASDPAHLRDLYFGLLGPSAREVVFGSGSEAETQRVASAAGAYLFVRASTSTREVASGGGTSGTGVIHPTAPLRVFAYRINGHPCERAAYRRPPDPCPVPSGPQYLPALHPPARDLHEPLEARLSLGGDHVVQAAVVTFVAPMPVRDAGEAYRISIPLKACHSDGTSYTTSATQRDVKVGERITQGIGFPFENACGRRKLSVEVLYEHLGHPNVLVGRTVLHLPTGARPAPPR